MSVTARKKIRHAIVGCGRVAQNHIYACSLLKEVELRYFCDIDIDKAKTASFNAENSVFLQNFEDIANSKEIDSVSICTDHGSHYEIAKSCIKSGKHVIIEKPICILDSDAAELCKLSKLSPSIICAVVSQHRYDPLITHVYNAIKQGLLGNIVSVSGRVQCCKDKGYYSGWRGTIAYEGGSTLINQGIHTLDLMLWICGEVKQVKAFSNRLKYLDIETEDNLSAILEFNSGALGTLACTNASTIEWDSYIDLVGTKGSITFTTDFPNTLRSFSVVGNTQLRKELETIALERTTPPVGHHYYGVSHNAQLQNYFQAIKGNEKLKVTIMDGIETLKVVNRIYLACNADKASCDPVDVFS